MATRYKSIRIDRAVELEKELSEKVAELLQKAKDADSKEEGKDEHLNQEMKVLVSVASESIRHQRKFDFRPHSHTQLQPPKKHHKKWVADMQEAMEQERQKELYKKRKSTVEPIFGIIKQVLSFRAPRTPHPKGQSPALALSLRRPEHPSSSSPCQNLKRNRLLGYGNDDETPPSRNLGGKAQVP